MVIRQGQYALALLEADPCHVPGCKAHHELRIEVDGDICGSPVTPLIDLLLLTAGMPVPGLVIGGVPR